MKTRIFRLFILIILALGVMPAAAQEPPKISRMGEYSGYSSPQYTEWIRTSEYVTVRDGTRLAVDVIRPAVNGKPVESGLPTIYVHERYQRALFVNGQPVTQPRLRDFWETWVRYGYAFASADIRGGGASFGGRSAEIMDVDSRDASDVIQWLAGQSWSNGNVGMIGISYNAITQFLAAGAQPPALKAIIPQMVTFDLYTFVYPGGVFKEEFMRSWALTSFLVDQGLPPVPVDADTDGKLAAEAVAQHRENISVYDSRDVPYRDSLWKRNNDQPYIDWTLNRFADEISASGVAVYQIAGWYDMWPRDQALWYANIAGTPRRIAFAPFPHGVGFVPGWQAFMKNHTDDDFSDEALFAWHNAEHLRFFDYHLRGIDNGIMAEAPIWYYTMGAPAGQAWRSTDSWPPAETQRVKWYFAAGPSNTVKSVNDGLLSMEKPLEAAADLYTVDYSTTTGNSTRWHNGHGGPFGYPDMTTQGQKSLTYTTPPFTAPVEVTGHPIITLWAETTAPDGDFFAYLEEIDAAGKAIYITEGVLRASHRNQHPAPYENFGLPFHRGLQADVVAPPKGEPVELTFDLLPTSFIVEAGHRLRVRVVGADAGNFRALTYDPAPVVSLYRGGDRASFIDLPILPGR